MNCSGVVLVENNPNDCIFGDASSWRTRAGRDFNPEHAVTFSFMAKKWFPLSVLRHSGTGLCHCRHNQPHGAPIWRGTWLFPVPCRDKMKQSGDRSLFSKEDPENQDLL